MAKETTIDTILRTKLHWPSIPRDHVHRRRLLEYLDQRRERPLSLVSASPGYGKSTLLSVFKIRFSAFVQQGLAMLNIVRILPVLLLGLLVSTNAGAFEAPHFRNEFDIGGQPAFSVIQDREGFLWFTSLFNGLVRYDGNSVKYFRSPDFLSNDFTTQIYQDSQGVIWIGTNNGLNRYEKADNSVTVFFADPSQPQQSLAGNSFPLSAQTIIEDKDGIMWFGTETGLSSFDSKSQSFYNYTHEENDDNSLPGNNIHAVFEDREGYIWVATRTNGIARIDKTRQHVRRYVHDPHDSKSLPTNDIVSIVEDEQGYLWLSSEGQGLIRFDKKTQRFTQFKHNPEDPRSIPDMDLSRIYVTKSGNFILSGDTEAVGLVFFDPKSKQTKRYQVDPGRHSSLSTNAVLTAFEAKDGILWIVHNNGKVDKYDPSSFIWISTGIIL